MSELKNYAEIKFVNPVLIDILQHYAENNVLATFVSESGEISMKFRLTEPQQEAPKSCEQVLSLLFALLESNSESPVGKIYEQYKTEILRETVLRLSHVLDGFGTVKISMNTSVKIPGKSDQTVTKHTEFTLNRTKTETKTLNEQ